jgi:hypothetical protein
VLFLVTGIGTGALVERERRARAIADAERVEAERLHRVAEQARVDALASANRAERLQRAAEALSVAITPEEVLAAVLTEGVAAAEARAGLIALVTADGTTLEVVAERGFRRDLLQTWRTFPIAAEYPLSEAVRTGEPVFLGSEQARVERFPSLPSTGEPT